MKKRFLDWLLSKRRKASQERAIAENAFFDEVIELAKAAGVEVSDCR